MRLAGVWTVVCCVLLLDARNLCRPETEAGAEEEDEDATAAEPEGVADEAEAS